MAKFITQDDANFSGSVKNVSQDIQRTGKYTRLYTLIGVTAVSAAFWGGLALLIFH